MAGTLEERIDAMTSEQGLREMQENFAALRRELERDPAVIDGLREVLSGAIDSFTCRTDIEGA